MLLVKESVLSFEEKNHNIGLPTFKLPVRTNPLNIIFDDLSI